MIPFARNISEYHKVPEWVIDLLEILLERKDEWEDLSTDRRRESCLFYTSVLSQNGVQFRIHACATRRHLFFLTTSSRLVTPGCVSIPFMGMYSDVEKLSHSCLCTWKTRAIESRGICGYAR